MSFMKIDDLSDLIGHNDRQAWGSTLDYVRKSHGASLMRYSEQLSESLPPPDMVYEIADCITNDLDIIVLEWGCTDLHDEDTFVQIVLRSDGEHIVYDAHGVEISELRMDVPIPKIK